MREVLIIGSGVAGMSCAIRCAELGMHVTLASPFPSERAQSVMAAGGINAVTADCEEGDSIESHIEDTLRAGAYLAGEAAVTGLCSHAGEILRDLERIGTVFTVDAAGRPMRRAFGGQSHRRTHYCGAGTGKLMVSALVMEVRRWEAAGLVQRRLRCCFHSALLRSGVCYGALLFDESTWSLEPVFADAVVIATGGQNALFGKTTGSTQCDGYAAGQLFRQGAALKNLEFIQYHPTTLETAHKRMLVSEAARGEGGRLFDEENGARVYFLEDKYGPGGNLMTRDIISREMEATGRDIFLDISFLDGRLIDERLPEVRDLCMKYRGIDVRKQLIPVAPSVHFFMGGLAVRLNHETSLRNCFAVGECASMYHGANRLGGNSLLAAMYSGRVAAEAIAGRVFPDARPDFTAETEAARRALGEKLAAQSPFPAMYIRDMLAATAQRHLGIVRDAASLQQGIADVDYDLDAAARIRYDASVLPYFNYSLPGILTVARAALTCALARTESRGAHWRSDFPETDPAQAHASIVTYEDGAYRVTQDKEREYES